MINPKVEVEFTTHGTHNLFGNIWPGRKIITAKSVAEKLIRQGNAKYPGDAPADVDGGDEGLEAHTVKELKAMADDLGVEYAKNAKKADLIEAIEAAQNADEDEDDESDEDDDADSDEDEDETEE